jgi:FemAB-related protein (PEP-CTERM system-associated)
MHSSAFEEPDMPDSLRITEYPATDDGEWDRFVNATGDGTVYHTLAWRAVTESALGYEPYYLCARDTSDRIRGILPMARLKSLLFGNFMVSLPYVNYCGSISNDPDVGRQLMQAACELGDRLGVSHVEFRDRAPRADMWPVRVDKVEMALELEATPDAQWGLLKSKLRAQIRRPLREGEVFSRNMRDLGTPVYSRALFAEMTARLGERTDIVTVSVDDTPVAAGMLLHHGLTTEIPSASSLREYNRIGVNMLLYWECLKLAIERGSSRFDFGRSSVDSGTYRFKKQWGAEPHQLYWHYWLRDGQTVPKMNPDNPKYALAINAWRMLPLWLANRLGPHLARLLP